MELSPYLSFNGDCAAAFRFYEQVLGGKIIMMQTHGESPMKEQVSPEWRDKVIHARLVVDGKVLMGSDFPPSDYAPPHGIQVSVNVTSPVEGERIFKALAEGGTVNLPFQKTFWSPGFGMAVDRFGTPWMVNTEPAA
jgi:PhnB protein